MFDDKLITTLKEVAHIPGMLGFIIMFTGATAVRCPDQLNAFPTPNIQFPQDQFNNYPNE